jgi:hypothetical protein
MNNSITACHVCATAVDPDTTAFCTNCHWELMVLPNDPSPGLQEYYQQRRTLHEQAWALQNTQAEEIAQLRKRTALTGRLADEGGNEDSWVRTGNSQRPIRIVWEIVAPLRFQFQASNLASMFPTEMVLLLKKESMPRADADFEFALFVETAPHTVIDRNTCEISVVNKYLQTGAYYCRFKNLHQDRGNLIYYHVDQSNARFDRKQTLINI